MPAIRNAALHPGHAERITERNASIVRAYQSDVPMGRIKDQHHVCGETIRAILDAAGIVHHARHRPGRRAKAIDARPRCVRCEIILAESGVLGHPAQTDGPLCGLCLQELKEMTC